MVDALAGIDIGGTNLKVVLTSTSLKILDRTVAPTPAHMGGSAIVGAAVRALQSLLERNFVDLQAVGVGSAGVVDRAAGRILVTGDSFTGWAGYRVRDSFSERLDVPAALENDVDAYLRGEAAAGAAVGEQNALGITLGTGVGGALLLEGKIYAGARGAAGEIGHIPGFGSFLCSCGQRGHLETLASGRAVTDRYRERTGRTETSEEIAARARQGDTEALDVFRAAGEGLARGVLVTAGLLDVSMAIIGGGVAQAWDLLEPPMMRAIAAEPPVSGTPVQVLRTRLGADAVALGAASLARNLVLVSRRVR